MSKLLYIDLTRLNPEYKGGATRFAQGLADALPEAVKLHKGDKPEPGATIIAPQCRVNFPKCRTILCIHDIQHEVYPENFTWPVRWKRRIQYRRAAHAARRIQVSSDTIWQDIRKYYGNSIASKCFLAPEGYDEKLWSPELPDRKPDLPLPNQFVYYPAHLWKHKNHSTIINGLQNSGITLVLTGEDYGELNKILTLAAARTNVIYLGIIPEIEMRWLYKNAICTIAAGYYESGSLPLKEALACGGKVLAADIEPNMGLKGLVNLWYFETFSPLSFAQQLENIIKKYVGGWRDINEFRWSKIVDIYRQVING